MTRESVINFGLILHVLAGVTGFFVAPAAMLTVKGGLWHRRWGQIYFWSMTFAAISAILLSTFGPRKSPFLTGRRAGASLVLFARLIERLAAHPVEHELGGPGQH